MFMRPQLETFLQNGSGASGPKTLLQENPRELPEFARIFGNGAAVEVEIGCGKAKFLIARAIENPSTNFLGVDPMRKKQKYAVTRSGKRGLENIKFLRAEARETIHCGFRPESVSVFHIYFPDPWPKRRQRKRRLVTGVFLRMLHEKLTCGGLIEVATDHLDYFTQMQGAVIHSGIAWSKVTVTRGERPFGATVKTNYEMKYEAAGRDLFYLELRK